MHAIMFLYKQVLGIDLPWLDGITRAKPSQRLPVVLMQDETKRLLSATRGTLLAALKLTTQPLELYAAYGWPDRMKVIKTVKNAIASIESPTQEQAA